APWPASPERAVVPKSTPTTTHPCPQRNSFVLSIVIPLCLCLSVLMQRVVCFRIQNLLQVQGPRILSLLDARSSSLAEDPMTKVCRPRTPSRSLAKHSHFLLRPQITLSHNLRAQALLILRRYLNECLWTKSSKP